MTDCTSSKMSEASPSAKPRQRRPYRSAGRDEQKRETQARILECALQHFSERGFEAASLRDIAAESGFNHAVIRLHFGTKENLWRAAIDLMFERQDAELAFRDWGTVERLTAEDVRNLIHAYVRYCARHTEHVRIMIHDTLRDSERVQWLVERHVSRVQAPLHPLLSRAMAEKIVIDVPLPSLMYIFTSASQMIFALAAEAKHLFAIDVNDPALVKAHADAICSMLIRSD